MISGTIEISESHAFLLSLNIDRQNLKSNSFEAHHHLPRTLSDKTPLAPSTSQNSIKTEQFQKESPHLSHIVSALSYTPMTPLPSNHAAANAFSSLVYEYIPDPEFDWMPLESVSEDGVPNPPKGGGELISDEIGVKKR